MIPPEKYDPAQLEKTEVRKEKENRKKKKLCSNRRRGAKKDDRKNRPGNVKKVTLYKKT